MQQWVAWCELGDPSSPGYEKRLAKRRELQESHCVWERTSMLPYQKDQLRSPFGRLRRHRWCRHRHHTATVTAHTLPPPLSLLGTVDEETEVPEEQRTRARVLWDKSLYSDADKVGCKLPRTCHPSTAATAAATTNAIAATAALLLNAPPHHQLVHRRRHGDLWRGEGPGRF